MFQILIFEILNIRFSTLIQNSKLEIRNFWQQKTTPKGVRSFEIWHLKFGIAVAFPSFPGLLLGFCREEKSISV